MLSPQQINGIEVMRVVRQGRRAIHYIPEAVPEATEVNLVIDWSRRFDHMQQHSGAFRTIIRQFCLCNLMLVSCLLVLWIIFKHNQFLS